MSLQIDMWQMGSYWPVARSAEEMTCKYWEKLKINVLFWKLAELYDWVSDTQKF